MKSESSRARRGARWAPIACALALLASCGGGDLVTAFAPRRIVAFGDETSALTTAGQVDPVTQQAYDATGKNWGVNAVDSTSGALVCQNDPNWVQYLAQSWGLPFPQCNPNGGSAPSIDHAANGATVDGVSAQIDAHLAADTLSDKDLVTLLVGANDILAQYALYDGSNEAALSVALEERGSALAGLVHRLVAAGGKVIVLTVPDLGVTPFALTEKAAHTDTDRAALLTRLTDRFNAKLRVGLVNDSGRDVGLVLGDQVIQFYAKFPAAGGFVDVIDPLCTQAPPNCTTATLDTTKSVTPGAFSWLWATPTLLSAGGQRQLGIAADSRSRNNPF